MVIKMNATGLRSVKRAVVMEAAENKMVRKEYFKEYNKRYYQEHKEEEKARAIRNRDKIKGYRDQDSKRAWTNNRYHTNEVVRKKHKARRLTLHRYQDIPKGYERHHFEPYHPDNFAIIPKWMHKIEHNNGWKERLCF